VGKMPIGGSADDANWELIGPNNSTILPMKLELVKPFLMLKCRSISFSIIRRTSTNSHKYLKEEKI
jgi:hypothetical protein